MLFQLDFMQEDQCILVDFEDNVIGYDDKFECHIFSPERPRGKLHRAFSVFLFDQSGRLLLQQRAKEKITFPEVWTNTCCSHPLTGYTPTEQDEPHHVADGSVPGVKRAAIRKLEHELGIPASQFEIDDFRFVARLHYWAADAVTHGPESPFGEHEIDYVLFVQKTVTLEPNASEVGGFEYVTPEQLLTLMMPESGPLPLHIFAQTFAHSHPTVVITYFGWQVVCGLPGSASWPHACYCRSGLGSRQSSTVSPEPFPVQPGLCEKFVLELLIESARWYCWLLGLRATCNNSFNLTWGRKGDSWCGREREARRHQDPTLRLRRGVPWRSGRCRAVAQRARVHGLR